MRFWTLTNDRWMGISSEVAVQVNAVLKEAGIEIPFPQRDLHVRSVADRAAASPAGGPVAKPAAPEEEHAG